MRVRHANGKVSEGSMTHHDSKRGVGRGFVSKETQAHERSEADKRSEYTREAVGPHRELPDEDYSAPLERDKVPHGYGR